MSVWVWLLDLGGTASDDLLDSYDGERRLNAAALLGFTERSAIGVVVFGRQHQVRERA
jgi:hypothetical protein